MVLSGLLFAFSMLCCEVNKMSSVCISVHPDVHFLLFFLTRYLQQHELQNQDNVPLAVIILWQSAISHRVNSIVVPRSSYSKR